MNSEKSFRIIFDNAYEGFCNSFQGFYEFAQSMGEMILVCVIYITLPVWILPYAIIKKRGAKR